MACNFGVNHKILYLYINIYDYTKLFQIHESVPNFITCSIYMMFFRSGILKCFSPVGETYNWNLLNFLQDI